MLKVGAVTGILLTSGFLVILVAVLASVAGMLLRLHRSVGVARQQLRLVAAGAAAIAVGLLILLVGQAFNGGQQSWWSSMPLFLAYAFLLACIAVAVLRYRLYEVEVILSRAVVLTIATAFVAVIYVGLVVVLGRSAQDRAGGGFWLSLLLTVAVALAFQPLRSRVVRFADRLAYGSRAAPYDALADFSHRIGLGPAPGTLLPTIAAAAADAVHADRALVRFEVEGGADLTARWPSTAGDVDADDEAADPGRDGLDPGPARSPRLDRSRPASGSRCP